MECVYNTTSVGRTLTRNSLVCYTVNSHVTIPHPMICDAFNTFTPMFGCSLMIWNELKEKHNTQQQLQSQLTHSLIQREFQSRFTVFQRRLNFLAGWIQKKTPEQNNFYGLISSSVHVEKFVARFKIVYDNQKWLHCTLEQWMCIVYHEVVCKETDVPNEEWLNSITRSVLWCSLCGSICDLGCPMHTIFGVSNFPNRYKRLRFGLVSGELINLSCCLNRNTSKFSTKFHEAWKKIHQTKRWNERNENFKKCEQICWMWLQRQLSHTTATPSM